MLFATIRRGKNTGLRLFPHRFDDDRFRVVLGRSGPYIPVADERDIPSYLANGYSLSMSGGADERTPRLIRPRSIRGWDGSLLWPPRPVPRRPDLTPSPSK